MTPKTKRRAVYLLATALCAVALFLPRAARANTDPVTVETKWQEKMFSVSTTGVTAATFDIGGFGGVGFSVIGSTYTLNGVDGSVYGATATVAVVNGVLNAPNVVGSNYLAYSTNTFTLQISQTIKTPVPSNLGQGGPGYVMSNEVFNTPYAQANFFTVPVISTSAPINVPASVLWVDSFRAQTTNPIFRMTNLSPGATYFLTVDYFVPRAQ